MSDFIVYAAACVVPLGTWVVGVLLLAFRQPYLRIRPIAVRCLMVGHWAATAQLVAAIAWGVLLPTGFPAVVFRAAVVAALGIIPSTVLFIVIDLWRLRLEAALSEKGD